MTTILFGSIGTLADTSELQRQAFNDAFSAHGLDWHWEREEYRTLLRDSGGQQRIAARAASTGQTVDAAAVHRTKSELFQRRMAAAQLTPRPGVVDTIRAARSAGQRVALVTTTSPDNVATLLQALAPAVRAEDFDLVVDATQVTRSKPSPDAYAYAVASLGVSPHDCVAVEDSTDGVRSAAAAGVPCVAFPGENTVDHDFQTAAIVVDRLDATQIQQLGA